MELISYSTVVERTILRAESTLKNIPFSHSRKLEVNPLYMCRLSIGVWLAVVKYFPDFPISMYPNRLMIPLRELLRNSRKTPGLAATSNTFRWEIAMVYSFHLTSNGLGHSSLEKMQKPLKTGSPK